VIVVRRRLTRVAALAVPAILTAAPAAAQRPAQPASAEAFRFCREQEKLGDARACWGVWLQKYRASGTDAEVAYAQAHPRSPASPSAANARLQLTSTPSGAVTLDGRPLGMTPIDVVEVPPGEHRLAFVNQGRSEGRTITVTALESRVVNVDFDAPPPTQMGGPRNPPPARTTMPVGDVLDFCALSPREGTRKERVVLLAPSGSRQVNDDAAIRAVDGARLVREVFAARFAMERFHNVLGSFSGKRGWEQRETLSVAEVQAFVKDAHDEGGAENDGRVEREKPFIEYSLRCADYLAIPSVTSHETKWEAPGTARELALTMNGALGIFRRQGEWWQRVALLSASAPSFADVTSDRGPAPVTASSSGSVPVFPSYVSGVPDARCVQGKSATDGLPGLVACGTKGEGTFEQALGDRDEHGGAECERARGGSTPDDERMTLSVRCAVRARSYELARGLQEDARKIEGWNLAATLRHASTAPSVSLGRADGMKLGDAFEVVDEHHRRLAFMKAVEVGPGGSAGEAQHTLLRTRLGEAPEGARIDAYPQLGLVIAPYASFAMITYSYGTTRVHSGSEFQDFTLPEVVFGGGATLGFDLSALLHSTETYARVGAGLFVGSGLNTTARLVPIDLWLEKGFYLGGRFTVAAAAGFTVQNSSVNVLTALAGVEEDLHVSSVMYGPAARLGVDVMLRPEWSVRLETAVRIPLNSASYTESDGKTVPDEWLARDDHFATIAANLGLAKTF